MSPLANRLLFGLSFAVLPLTFSGVAAAQNARSGQVQQRILNVINAAANPSYGANGVSNHYYGGYNPGYNQPYRQSGQPYYNSNPYAQNQFAPGYGRWNGQAYTPPGQVGYRSPQYDPYTRTTSAQRYQVPAQFNGQAPGSVINYGGSNYILGHDGTMTPSNGPPSVPNAGPTSAQRYQVPAHYVGTAPGYVINYGGTNYITNSDGTMSPYSGAVAR